MDERTAGFYRHYVNGGGIAVEAPRSAMSAYFAAAFPPGGRILDVGAGSGRDLAALLDDGFDAWGLEPNEDMRAFAVRARPALADRLRDGALPVHGLPFGGRFDGIVCSAVLMHVPATVLPDALASVRDVLVPGGRVLMSMPWMRPESIRAGRDADGRLFENHPSAAVVDAMAKLGFVRVDLGEDAVTVLPDVSWTIYLFESGRGA